MCVRLTSTESFMKTFSQIIRNYWVDLVLLNLAFLLGCIPVVTIPASLSALSRALLRMQREENVHIFRDFFRDIKIGFRRSLLPGCILLAGLALSGKILICEDISCGVVPMDAAERAWRERHGALLQQLAQRSETVIRIFCGLPQQLKP